MKLEIKVGAFLATLRLLVASGFSDPAIEIERLTLTYASFDELIAELRATCGPNAARGRPRWLTGKARHRDLARGDAVIKLDFPRRNSTA